MNNFENGYISKEVYQAEGDDARAAKIVRKTRETEIKLFINLDGYGNIYSHETGVYLFDHFLDAMAKNGRFDTDITCDGDIQVDAHHTVEDVGITMGIGVTTALGEDKAGIHRYGSVILPMDDALVMTAIDLSGRCYLNYDVQLPSQRIGDLDTEAIQEFFYGFCRSAGATIHIKQLAGTNTHHILECMFKSFGIALGQACAIDPSLHGTLCSTKGLL